MSNVQKIALVTGANKGIGFEICRKLGKLGITVFVGARDQKRGLEAVEKLKSEGIDAHALIIDVTHQPSVTRAAEIIEEKFQRLDILVNNAGIMENPNHTASTTPLDILRDIFNTNFFGAVAVAQAMVPLLRKSEAGRIVNISSSLGSLTLHADPAGPFADMKIFDYDSSKSALNSLTIHLAHELSDTPIKVNSACPGWVKTDMGGENAPGTAEEGADTPVWLATLPADGPTGNFFNSRNKVPW